MSDTPVDQSVKLFFDSFAKHLRRIRDDGKDAGQAYRAQILLGQLFQFEKAVDEWRGDLSQGQGEQKPGAWMHISDLEALVHWLSAEQTMAPMDGIFYLDRYGVWQNLYGDAAFPSRLKVGTWLERGQLGRLDGDKPGFLIYTNGQPRLIVFPKDCDSSTSVTMVRFVARILPLFIGAEIIEINSLQSAGEGMIAADPVFLEVLALVKRVASKDVTILLEGESGTGKEVIANFIHRNSERSDKPFVAVNCAAIPAGLIESELFGHEKGSFTGAHQRKIGRLEEAQDGTLFLDEIGEVELAMQAKLLRFIQLREFHRVGGRQKLSVNVRIVAATNRDLKERVAEGHFREDLYYRLSVAPFKVPPLRSRTDDIVPLARFFMNKYSKEFNMKVPEVEGAVYQLMAAYPFPGNVRELENLIQNILVLSQGETITPAHLPPDLQQLEPKGEVVPDGKGGARTWRPRSTIGKRFQFTRLSKSAPSVSSAAQVLPWHEDLPTDNDQLKHVKQVISDFARRETLELEKRFLENLLEKAGGSMPMASKISGINRTLLYKMLERTKEE